MKSAESWMNSYSTDQRAIYETVCVTYNHRIL